ncbi:MAG TPA: DUF188 domain-containing protein [Bacillota bacterium]|mgnify:CR=1 FL=1|nr:DUF188 domain-containing protein [Bacillota bacterium]
MKIIVDADAAPRQVLEICRRAAADFSTELVTVAGFNHNIDSDRHITVGNDPQEADIRILNLTERGDIVVTQDWGLAAVALSKGAAALSFAGRIFRNDTVDFLLEEREIKAKLRRSGGRTGGPRKRTAGDDENFKKSLYALLKAVT